MACIETNVVAWFGLNFPNHRHFLVLYIKLCDVSKTAGWRLGCFSSVSFSISGEMCIAYSEKAKGKLLLGSSKKIIYFKWTTSYLLFSNPSHCRSECKNELNDLCRKYNLCFFCFFIHHYFKSLHIQHICEV